MRGESENPPIHGLANGVSLVRIRPRPPAFIRGFGTASEKFRTTRKQCKIAIASAGFAV